MVNAESRSNIDFHGKKIYYWIVGEGKRELVFLHGWAGKSEWWIRQIPALSKEYRMILVDLPGHGQSESLSKYGEKTLCSVLTEIIKILDVRKPVLFGWSLGGVVALQYALDHPNKISGLILIDTLPLARAMPSLGFLPTIPYHWMPDIRRVQPLIEVYSHFPETVLSFIYRLYSRRGVAALLVNLLATGKKPDKRLVSWCTQTLLKDLNIKALFKILVAMVGFDLAERLSEIDVPTLIIHGNEDKLLSIQYAELLHQNIKGSILKIVEGSGHCPHLEKPKDFNDAVLEFLKKIFR